MFPAIQFEIDLSMDQCVFIFVWKSLVMCEIDFEKWVFTDFVWTIVEIFIEYFRRPNVLLFGSENRVRQLNGEISYSTNMHSRCVLVPRCVCVFCLLIKSNSIEFVLSVLKLPSTLCVWRINVDCRYPWMYMAYKCYVFFVWCHLCCVWCMGNTFCSKCVCQYARDVLIVLGKKRITWSNVMAVHGGAVGNLFGVTFCFGIRSLYMLPSASF